MIKHSILIISLVLCSLTVAQAQNVMSLRDCMQMAVSNSTDMRIQQADIREAQINHREAILKAFTPDVGANLGTDLGFGRILDSNTNTYINADATATASMGLGANMMIFNGFSAINNIKFYNTLIKMGGDNEEIARAKVCLATMEAYYNVVYYTRLSSIQADQVETSKKALELVKKQESLGTKAYSDIIEIEAELAEREYDLIKSENLRKSSLITLQDLMFWNPEEELVIDTEVSDEEYVTLAEPYSEDDIINFAKQNQASAKVAFSQMENAKLALTSAKLAIIPTLSASAGISSRFSTPLSSIDRTSINNQIGQNNYKYISLTLSIPIFTRFSYVSNIGRKQVAYDKASAQYDQKLRDIEAEVHRAIQDRDGASSAYLQAERKADIQKQAYSLNQRKYDQGLISTIELQTATNNYLKAEADKLNTLFTYIIKKHVVNYYNGINFLDQK